MFLALLLSLAAHVATGWLLKDLGSIPFEAPRPLVVVLEAPPPAPLPPAQPAPTPRIERSRPTREPVPITASEPPRRASPAPEIVADQPDPAPTTVAPAPESAPTPATAAKPPAMAGSAPRVETVEPPQFNVAYLNNPRPVYPAIARRLGLEGVVVLRVEVTATGSPREITVAKSSGASVLDDAAMKAVRGWTFVPARRGDTPIAHLVEVPIRFELRN